MSLNDATFAQNIFKYIFSEISEGFEFFYISLIYMYMYESVP